MEFRPRIVAAGARHGAVASAIFADFGAREIQSQLIFGATWCVCQVALSHGYPTRRQRSAQTELVRKAEASKSGEIVIGLTCA